MSKTRTNTTPAKPQAASAARRRSTNGLMLAVAVTAAVGIVLILNYVVYWQYRGLSAESRSLVRYDLTSTRRYSLSQQSRAVLESLDKPHRVVTMLGGSTIGDEQQQRIRDLVDEYARASPLIEVQHIDLDSESGRRGPLLAEMDAMFAEDTQAVRASIAQGLEQVERYAEVVDQIESGLKKVIDSGVEIRPRSVQGQRLTDLHSQYLRLQDRAERLRAMRDEMLGRDWQTRLEEPGIVAEGPGAGADLPDYTVLMASIQQYVITLTRQTLPDTPGKADQLRRGVVPDAPGGPGLQQPALEAQNTFASLVQQVPQLLRKITAETDPLLNVTPPLRYEDARAILNDEPCVLLTSGGDARVLPAELLFRGAGSANSSEETSGGDLFVGEEQLSGALVSMTLDPPPLVVFIRSNSGFRALSATSADQQVIDGVYDHVTKRLLAMDFEVVEWANPLRDDPPTPKPDQRVVWISLPYLKPDINRRESLDHTRKDAVAAFLEDRLAKGEGALVMLSFNPDTDPRLATADKADSLVTLLDKFGVEAQLYHNASRLDTENEEDTTKSRYSSEFLISDWPDSAIVGRALDGIDTYFFAPMPLVLKPVQGVKQTPLIKLTHPALYVQRTVPDRETGQFTPQPDSERASVLIGAAIEKEDARLVTIGDATWALDNLTSAGRLLDGRIGPNLADKPGARLAYPGNTDLFVNCICWLAHENELIAASPRTQDVRRIKAIEPATVQAYRMILWGGMPAVIFAIGTGVWLMRRRA